MEDHKEKPSVSITIHDSTVQVVPSATEATMNFYGDQFAPKEFRQQQPVATPTVAPQSNPSESADEKRRSDAISILRMHITDENRLNDYLQCLSICKDATQLAQVAVSMRKKEKWPDEVEIKKERFINMLKVLAPGVTKGDTVSNIRARIKAIL